MSFTIQPKLSTTNGDPVKATREFDQMCACWVDTTPYVEKPVTMNDPVTGGTMTLLNVQNLPTIGRVQKFDDVSGSYYWDEVKASPK